MSRKPIDEAVKDFEDAWNKHDLEYLKEQLEMVEHDSVVHSKKSRYDYMEWIGQGNPKYEGVEQLVFPFGIVNFEDNMFLGIEPFPDSPPIDFLSPEELKKRKDYQSWVIAWKEKKKKHTERMQHLEELIKNFQGVRFRLKQKQKYGDLQLGRPPHSWEHAHKRAGELIWGNWAVVDLGTTDPTRRGGLMKYGGYGRAEPKKYLRGHLYPETIIKEGWLPKKQKDKVGKPYSSPLHGAISKGGQLHTYGPEYFE